MRRTGTTVGQAIARAFYVVVGAIGGFTSYGAAIGRGVTGWPLADTVIMAVVFLGSTAVVFLVTFLAFSNNRGAHSA